MKRFSIVQNGYDIDEVNRFIDIVIRRLELLDNENKKSLAEIESLKQKLNSSSNQIDSEKISKALLAAQDASERMRSLAQEEAKMILEDAKRNATKVINNALAKAERIESEAEALRRKVAVYKRRFRALVEDQLDELEQFDERI